MNYIINNNHILEQLRCSKCWKFLSVLPVKVYPNKTVLCGRCVKRDDSGVFSLYCDLIEDFYFKCVNHVEGCNVLLKPSEVVEHEETCKSTNVKCPICPRLNIPVYLIPKHFQDVHRKYILKKPELKIGFNEDDAQFWMYLCNDIIFLIKILVDNKNGSISMDCMHYCNRSLQYSVQIKDEHGLNITSSLYKCQSQFNEKHDFTTQAPGTLTETYNINIVFSGELSSNFQEIQSKEIYVPPMLTRIIYLTKEFKQEYPDWKLTVTKRAIVSLDGCITSQGFCSSCQYIIASIERKCEENGLCNKCSKINGELLKIYNNLRFYCVWKCNEHFSPSELYNHENICQRRDHIVCPIADCVKKCANTEVFKDHFNTSHNQVLMVLNEVVDIPRLTKQNVIIYFRHVLIDLDVRMVKDSNLFTYYYEVVANFVKLTVSNNYTCKILSKRDGNSVEINNEAFNASSFGGVKLISNTTSENLKISNTTSEKMKIITQEQVPSWSPFFAIRKHTI